MAEAPKKATRFRLHIEGADEDYPRKISVYGKACGGRFTMVVVPAVRESVLVFAMPVAKGSPKGTKESAVTYRGGLEAGTDALDVPTGGMGFDAAVALVRSVAAKASAKPGAAVTKKGAWRGELICHGPDASPDIILTRKVASYASIQVMSTQHGKTVRWYVTVKRDARWFADAATKAPAATPFLNDAIAAAYAEVLDLVRVACGARDTTRRAEVDAEYGAAHPPKRAKEAKNVLADIDKPRRGKAAAKAEPAPKPAKAPKAAAAPKPPKAAKPAAAPKPPKAAKPPERFEVKEVEDPEGHPEFQVVDTLDGSIVATHEEGLLAEGDAEQRNAKAAKNTTKPAKAPKAPKAAKGGKLSQAEKDAKLTEAVEKGLKNALGPAGAKNANVKATPGAEDEAAKEAAVVKAMKQAMKDAMAEV